MLTKQLILLVLLALCATAQTSLSGYVAALPQANGAGPTGFLIWDTHQDHYAGFSAAGSLSANLIWILPSADGSSGQCIGWSSALTLAWVTCSGGGGGTWSFTTSDPSGSCSVTTNFEYNYLDGSPWACDNGAWQSWDTLNTNQTITGAKIFTATNTITENILPSANGVYNLGADSFLWNNIFGVNAVLLGDLTLTQGVGSGFSIGIDINGKLSILEQPNTEFITFDGIPLGSGHITLWNNGYIVPNITNQGSLGTASLYWGAAYIDSLNFTSCNTCGDFVTLDTNQTITGTKTFASNILPDATGNSRTLGSPTQIWAVGYFDDEIQLTNAGMNAFLQTDNVETLFDQVCINFTSCFKYEAVALSGNNYLELLNPAGTEIWSLEDNGDLIFNMGEVVAPTGIFQSSFQAGGGTLDASPSGVSISGVPLTMEPGTSIVFNSTSGTVITANTGTAISVGEAIVNSGLDVTAGGAFIAGGTRMYGNIDVGDASTAGNLIVGPISNLYNRTVSASSGINCSGVADGWTAMTEDDYMAVCMNSGTKYLLPLNGGGGGGGAWTSYVPTFTPATGGLAAQSNVNCRYLQVGKTVNWRCYATLQFTATPMYVLVTLPIQVLDTDQTVVGNITTSLGAFGQVYVYLDGPTQAEVLSPGSGFASAFAYNFYLEGVYESI